MCLLGTQGGSHHSSAPDRQAVQEGLPPNRITVPIAHSETTHLFIILYYFLPCFGQEPWIGLKIITLLLY